MTKNRLNDSLYDSIASELNVPKREVARAVLSFFSVIDYKSRRLRLDNARRIYTREKFDDIVAGNNVCNIPCIGRIGPVYSRYLKWRANESSKIEQVLRSNYRSRILQSDIENMAEAVIAGRTPSPVEKKKKSELFNQVWMVGRNGKKLARQVIPKAEDECLKSRK